MRSLLIALGIAWLVNLLGRAYYVFVFLPRRHESFTDAAWLLDTEGWWAFVTSPVGAVSYGAIVLAWIGLGIAAWRSRVKEEGSA